MKKLFLIVVVFGCNYVNAQNIVVNTSTVPIVKEFKTSVGVFSGYSSIPRKEEMQYGLSLIDLYIDGCSDCDGATTGSCGTDDNGTTVCGWGGCGVIIANNLVLANPSLGLDTLSPTSDYNFRDNFLGKYAKGQQYITFYYKLMDITVTGNTITFGNLVSQIELGYQLESCAHTLQYGSSTDIPISTTLRDAALTEIATYRNYTSNTEYQKMLDQIEKDIKRFTGQTRGQIISFLQTNNLN